MKLKWIARISASIIVLLGIPFYLGYGNPLPFIDTSYAFIDNLWLCLFPIVFIGLVIGWVNEKLGGTLIIFAVLAGVLMLFLFDKQLTMNIILPFIVGILYVVSALKKIKNELLF